MPPTPPPTGAMLEPCASASTRSLEAVDWARAKADLAADDFDNGRSAEALRRSFAAVRSTWCSPATTTTVTTGRVVGMARLLSDGVCNAYLLDVWTASDHRRRGIATSMVRTLLAAGPGPARRVADRRRPGLLRVARLPPQPEFMSIGGGRVARPRPAAP